ncbi:hypothetical protein SAMN05421839_10631 [Halolactibacillus halophilus]|uniref:Uncharacterized protein n=1 Tax=Halolactibacillus halophilus TaxID=306540 RepID=A0A1I5MNM6_9BACI|nr:hypothetical protein SAMN05421839_10631 [Halolactibacillus halophilus]
MRYSEIIDAKKRIHVIQELANKFDYHDVQDKSYEKLVSILTHFRASEINHDHPFDIWF